MTAVENRARGNVGEFRGPATKRAWEIKRLADVLEVQNGYAFDSKGFNPTDGLPLIRIRSLKAGTETETRFNGEYNQKYVVKAGDLLIGMDGEFGCYEWKGEPALLNQRVCRLQVFSGELIPRFLLYGVNDYLKAIEDVTGYATVKHISSKQILNIKFPVPPLAEQQRIVDVLDEAFEGLATAEASFETNIQNARALFESQLQSVFAHRGPEWVEKKLADVAEFKNGLNFTRQSKGQTLRMVGVGDFQQHSVVPVETLQFVTIDGKLSDDYLIRRDDILTVRSNGSKDLVGRCMIVPDVDEITSFSGFIIRIRFDTLSLSPRFFLYFMKSSATRDRLTRDGGGTNISNINQTKLSELPLSLPTFEEQEEIANRLDALSEETLSLVRLYQQKLVLLAALKKSLLHHAFSGQL